MALLKKRLHVSNMKIKNQVLLLFLLLAGNASIIIIMLLLWLNGYIYSDVMESLRNNNEIISDAISQEMFLNETVSEQTVYYIESTGVIDTYLKEGQTKSAEIIYDISHDILENLKYAYVHDINNNEVIHFYSQAQPGYDEISVDYELQSKKIIEATYTKVYFSESGEVYYGYIEPIHKKDQLVAYYVSIYDFNGVIGTIEDVLRYRATLSVYTDEFTTYNSHSDALTYEEVISRYSRKPRSFMGSGFGRYYVHVNKVETTGWYYAVYTRKIYLYTDMIIMISLFLALTVMCIFIGVQVFTRIKNAISGPIDDMINQLENIEDFSKKQKIKVNVNNEVSRIGQHLNGMMDKIYTSNAEILDAQARLYEMDLSRARAELSYYQSQINPHFLYNNLECIRSMAAIYGSEEIEKISVAMSEIFRYSIKGDTIVCLEEEIQCIKSYFSIMNIRFPQRYELEIRINDVDLKTIQIPKMTLQPIVENAFKHGLIKNRQKGKVILSAKHHDEYYVIEVMDTGVGLTEEELNDLNKAIETDTLKDQDKRIGLANIHNRLKLHYGKKSGIWLESKKDHFTKVNIRIITG